MTDKIEGSANTDRVSVYIDGFNLYYGIKAAGWNHLKWLDLLALANSFLVEKQQLVQVKYFTTKLNGGNPDSESARIRQQVYLSALQTLGGKMGIIYGKFIDHDELCWKCNAPRGVPKEKMTDVKIAVQMMQDAFNDVYDTAILVSVDTDQVPTIKAVRQLQKKVKIAFPNQIEITESLVQAMKDAGVSNAELAGCIGTSRAYITKILQGDVNFTLLSLVRISRALGASLTVPAFQYSKPGKAATPNVAQRNPADKRALA